MECAQLLVCDHCRELAMELAPLRAARPLPRGRGQERVRRPHAVAVQEDDAGVDRLLDRVRLRDPRELMHPQVGLQGQGEQHAANAPRELGDARAEEVVDRVRHGHVVAGHRQAVDGERAAHLQREQRVAERGLEHPAEHVPREAEAELAGQEPSRRPEAERAHLQPLRGGALERALRAGGRAGAAGEQEGDGLRLQTPGREGEHVAGRGIEPLGVVDRDQHRLAGRKRAQCVEEADGDRVRLRRRARGRVGTEERDLESV